ncbi:helix-turn-helix domain-containing protein, partial [Thioalkalivibrio denitrificans]|uniref:helix-turn-helix domain-containing protein n=1 Tax=Thioalkalivibrio denitrificans TaxID=108003 RepID=UPI001C377949
MRALQHPEYRDLKDLRWRHLGLNLEQAAERCGVSPRVFQRWERQNKAPELALRLLRLLGGELGLIDPAWRDFHLVRGRLFYGEDPRGYEPGHVALLSSLLADRAVTAAERRKGCGAGIGKALPPTPAPEASDGLPPSSPESPSDSWPRSNWSLVGQSTPTPLGDRAHARASSKGQAAAKVGERGPNVLNTAYTLCEIYSGADGTRSPAGSGTDRGIAPRHAAVPDPMQWVAVGLAGIPLGTVIKS